MMSMFQARLQEPDFGEIVGNSLFYFEVNSCADLLFLSIFVALIFVELRDFDEIKT